MELKHVKSIEGSPQPADIFQPHMPGVKLLSDMNAMFGMARTRIAGLPFKYEELDADEVIKIILQPARWRWYQFFKTKRVLHARLATESHELLPVSFT